LTSNPTPFALTSLVCVVACTSFAFAQSRSPAAQSLSQLPQAQADPSPQAEAVMAAEIAREPIQALITDEWRKEGSPLRMPGEQIEAVKSHQSASGD
jgi:hypothetical protein